MGRNSPANRFEPVNVCPWIKLYHKCMLSTESISLNLGGAWLMTLKSRNGNEMEVECLVEENEASTITLKF